jgi:hypothetical protein
MQGGKRGPVVQGYRKRKCAFSQKHTIFITKIQVYMFLSFVALYLAVIFEIHFLLPMQSYMIIIYPPNFLAFI